MPNLRPEELQRFASEILQKHGVSETNADIVAANLVASNLADHDSHGVIRLRRYVPLIVSGVIRPNAEVTVLNEGPVTAVVDGNWGLGFIVMERAVSLAIEKARAYGCAAVAVRRQSHIGRLATYSETIARATMIGIVTADSGRAPKSVAPHGGRTRLLGTNPLSIAVPSAEGAPVVLDMATSTVAHGKVRVAAARGEKIPKGWVIDHEGHQTDDPTAMERGGALLPFGADQAHKGYGLSFMVEVLSGLLPDIGFSHDPDSHSNDGSFVMAIDVARFLPAEHFEQQIQAFSSYLKDSPRADGFDEILVPGELERRRHEERMTNGIDIEDATWKALSEMHSNPTSPSDGGGSR